MGGQLRQKGLPAILRRQRPGVGNLRPFDRDVRIVPRNAFIMLGTVIAGDAVADDRIRLERAESVAEADGNPQLVILLRGKHDRQPLAESGRIMAQVHRNIEQASEKAANELSLSLWMRLEMDAADGSGADAQRLIVLHERSRPRALRKAIETEHFREIAPLIFDLPRDDFKRSIEIEAAKFHIYPLS